MAGWTPGAVTARLLRGVAEHIDPQPPADALPPQKSELIDVDRLDEMRRGHAISLLDPECHGYVLIQLREDAQGALRLLPEHVMPAAAWPAVTDVLLRLADEAMHR